MRRELFDDDHHAFRDLVRSFAAQHVAPHLAQWEREGVVDRALFARAGEAGLLGLAVDEQVGGGGVDDFRFSAVLLEELCRIGATAVAMSLGSLNDLVAPYLTGLGDEAQQRRWLPALCSGASIAALGLSEPGAGSDLKALRTTARRDGDDYVVDGSKTFISNGLLADLVVLAVTTDPSAGARGISLLLVELGTPGIARGSKLDKLGLTAQDTAELFFDGARVPRANLLGEEGHGFAHLMRNLPQERLHVAVMAMASLRRMVELTTHHVQERRAFGQRIADFQSTRFVLAELATEVEVAQAYVDRCISAHVAGELTPVDAAMVKWWVTELQQRVATRCLQLHGGYGYMREHPIAREFLDARASTLYAGTTEIMKEIIGRAVTSTPAAAPGAAT